MTINNSQRDTVLKILQNLENAHENMGQMPECFKREMAYDLLEQAHAAVSALLVRR